MEGPAGPIAQSWVVPGRNRATCKRRPVVDKDTTYVALDDSKRKIVAGILRPSDTQPELREIANDARQIRRLFERLKREGPVAACYEAGVSGYDLHRQITGLGVACAVIAPALTPRRPGQRIKYRPPGRREARATVPRWRAHRHPRPRRERGGRARSRPLPRRHPPRCSPLAASRAQAPGPPRARLPHRQELEPRPLAMDP